MNFVFRKRVAAAIFALGISSLAEAKHPQFARAFCPHNFDGNEEYTCGPPDRDRKNYSVSRVPGLYEMVTKVFRRVAAAQEARIKNDVVPINYIFLLDSPAENAFVYRPPHKGVRVATNLVFITSAMLRRLIDLDPIQLNFSLSRSNARRTSSA